MAEPYNIQYCYEKCKKGHEFAEDLLLRCESVFDAAFDFRYFVKDCFVTCPYKQFHKETKNDAE